MRTLFNAFVLAGILLVGAYNADTIKHFSHSLLSQFARRQGNASLKAHTNELGSTREALDSPASSESNPSPVAEQFSEKADGNKQAVEEMKLLRPQIKQLIVDANLYKTMLDSLVTASKQIVSSSQALAQNPEAQKMATYDPSGAQQLLNQAIERYYDAFQRMVRTDLQTSQDGGLTEDVARISQVISARPETPVRTVLQDAVNRCQNAQKTVENYQSREQTNFNDKWNQVASIPNDLTRQIEALTAEISLLQATDSAIDKQ